MTSFDVRAAEEPYKGSPYPLGGLDSNYSANSFESRTGNLDVIIEEAPRPEGRKGDMAGQIVLLVCSHSSLLRYKI